MIYLASPYTHTDSDVVEQRHKDICVIAGNMMSSGLAVFSPIAHTHNMANLCNLPAEWCDFWKRQCMEMIRLCDGFWIVTLDGWQRSTGVRAEWEYARHIGRTEEFIDPYDWL